MRNTPSTPTRATDWATGRNLEAIQQNSGGIEQGLSRLTDTREAEKEVLEKQKAQSLVDKFDANTVNWWKKDNRKKPSSNGPSFR